MLFETGEKNRSYGIACGRSFHYLSFDHFTTPLTLLSALPAPPSLLCPPSPGISISVLPLLNFLHGALRALSLLFACAAGCLGGPLSAVTLRYFAFRSRRSHE